VPPLPPSVGGWPYVHVRGFQPRRRHAAYTSGRRAAVTVNSELDRCHNDDILHDRLRGVVGAALLARWEHQARSGTTCPRSLGFDSAECGPGIYQRAASSFVPVSVQAAGRVPAPDMLRLASSLR
jgi:hypothetical protein